MHTLFWLFTLFAINAAVKVEETRRVWNDFKTKYKKIYSDKQEQERFNIFRENLSQIKEHNKLYGLRKSTYKMGFNRFTDLTSAEFLGRFHNYNLNRRNYPREFDMNKAKRYEIPLIKDWRRHQVITPVKDQGECDASWAFSVIGALESHYNIGTKSKGDLAVFSEQQLIDCSEPYGNKGCFGGQLEDAFKYLMENGVASEEDYRYRAGQGHCLFDRNTAVIDSIQTFIAIKKGELEELKYAVALTGPVAALIEVTDKMQHYQEGVFFDRNCGKQLNHAVLVVGYWSDEDEEDHWIVKNSWGKDFGDEGYIKIARNRSNSCGIALNAYYPQVQNIDLN